MSKRIQQALVELETAVSALETLSDEKITEMSALRTKSAEAAAQADLFSTMPQNDNRGQKPAAGSANQAALAEKLDNAIAKVEKILQEG